MNNINTKQPKYVRLMGGLGNQMFQYAFARALEQTHNAPVYLDTSFLKQKSKNYVQRHYELNKLNIPNQQVKDYTSSKGFLYKLQNKLTQKNTFTEQGLQFQPEALIADKKLYIGYFQSQKYFQHIQNTIKRDFSVNLERLSQSSKNDCVKAEKTMSVSLHIRRGDYISIASNIQVHGTCSLNYYKSSIEYFKQRYHDIHFFIFSDDIPWCRDNLLLNKENTTFVDYNQGEQSYQDMIIMSHCKHNIIANSSFSWWAAWLNNNPSKTIIAPSQWFADTTIQTQDLLPDEWIKI